MPSTDNRSTQQRHIDHTRFELAKWIAIVTMTVDHYGKIVDPSLYGETNAIGRLAFPLFAWIIGSRLALEPGLAGRYLWYLVPWAIVTQPIYVWVGKSWGEPNIFFTLAVGVALSMAVREWRIDKFFVFISITTLAFLLWGANYGVFGLFIIPIIAKLNARNPQLGVWTLGPLGVMGNLIARAPYVGPGAIWALFAGIVAWGSVRLPVRLPRIPRLAFYAYYPAHLLILYGIAGYAHRF